MTVLSNTNNRFGGVPPFMERTLAAVRRILDSSKNPQYAADVDHNYEDKYSLVEFVTNTGIAATLNVLEQLDGFNEETLKKMIHIVQDEKRSVTLRLAVDETCVFVKETTRTVEEPTTHKMTVDSVEQDATTGTPTTTSKSSVVSHKTTKEVKEYHWEAGYNHRLILFSGTDDKEGIVLGSRSATTNLVTVVTKMKQEPFRPQTRCPLDLDLSFLFAHIDKSSLSSNFEIEREQAKTPRRNKQADEALAFVGALGFWSGRCSKYFCFSVRRELLKAYPDSCPADWLCKITANDVFVPIAPLFEEGGTPQTADNNNDANVEQTGMVSLKASPTDAPLLSLKDTTLFLQEQVRSLDSCLNTLVKDYPESSDQGQFISGYEAKLVLLWTHLTDVSRLWSFGIECVEQMLRSQLISAIGKEVDAKDFSNFLSFHNQRVFSKAHAPKPFCFAIRQPNQYPDGVLTIGTKHDNRTPGMQERNTKQDDDPIETFVRHIPGDSLVSPMSIPLNAATTVEFVGDQYLHGWMDTHFAGQRNIEHTISARARQFSCFMLMIGNLSGPNEFTPTDAVILQNKDEVLIPLLTNALPSAKEFRDAIKSLSPEQARFAKSYRAMQLDSSVFGICVVQVKPQMEALLQLPPGALTKEIQLTQDLLSLFVEHQIPPNLVSFDGDETSPTASKVSTVKQHVKGVLDVIQGIKQSQLEEEKQKAAARVEMERKWHADLEEESRQVPSFRFSGAGGSGGFGGGFGGGSGGFGGGGGGVAGAGVHYEKKQSRRMDSMACGEERAVSRSARPAVHSAFAAPPQMAMESAIMCDSMVGGAAEISFSADADGFDMLQDDKPSSEDKKSDMELTDTFASEQTDFTSIPKKLDRMFESYDSEGALRTVTLKTGDVWTRQRQENLLTKMQTTNLNSDQQKTETNKALDLLDALSRSGSLPIASGELHILIGVRHAFEKNIMATVIEENTNPIEKVDYSSLLIAATVHRVDVPTLLTNSVEPPTLVMKDRNFPESMIGAAGDDDETNEE